MRSSYDNRRNFLCSYSIFVALIGRQLPFQSDVKTSETFVSPPSPKPWANETDESRLSDADWREHVTSAASVRIPLDDWKGEDLVVPREDIGVLTIGSEDFVVRSSPKIGGFDLECPRFRSDCAAPMDGEDGGDSKGSGGGRDGDDGQESGGGRDDDDGDEGGDDEESGGSNAGGDNDDDGDGNDGEGGDDRNEIEDVYETSDEAEDAESNGEGEDDPSGGERGSGNEDSGGGGWSCVLLSSEEEVVKGRSWTERRS